jgi:hypothetical protein
LQPTDWAIIVSVLKNRTDRSLGEEIPVARGEFSSPVPRTDSFIYLRLSQGGGWQLL